MAGDGLEQAFHRRAQLARHKAAVDGLIGRLRGVAEYWEPAAGLVEQVEWVRRKLAELEERLDRKLLVVLAGPTGAGKSALLNALAGRAIAEEGLDRPTTRGVVAYCANEGDVEPLRAAVGDGLRTVVEPQAGELASVVLVDTPDTNSIEEANQKLLGRALGEADVVLAVLDAEHPRAIDNFRYLEPYLRPMADQSLVVVLNRMDRIAADEAERVAETVAGDVRREWQKQPDRFFRVSAAAAQAGREFPAHEQPLDGRNQFAELRAYLRQHLGRPGYQVDLRLAAAARLEELAQQAVARVVAERGEALGAARRAITEFEHGLQGEWQKQTQALVDPEDLGMRALVLASVAQRWTGPVGWLVWIWARMISTGTVILRLFRSRNPLTHLVSLVQMAVRYWSVRQAEQALRGEEGVPAHLPRLAQYIEQEWRGASCALERAGFRREAARGAAPSEVLEQSARGVQAQWQSAVDDEVAASARRMSGALFQLAANAPPLALLGWMGYETVGRFIAADYLSGDYFRHALFTLGIVLAVDFVAVQWIISVGAMRGIHGRIRDRFTAVAPALRSPAESWIRRLEEIERLAGG